MLGKLISLFYRRTLEVKTEARVPTPSSRLQPQRSSPHRPKPAFAPASNAPNELAPNLLYGRTKHRGARSGSTWASPLLLGLGLTLLAVPNGGCRRGTQAGHDQSNTPPSSDNKVSNKPAPAQEGPKLDVFAFGRQLGAIAPCGCTAEPLGGLSYAFGYIEQKSKDGGRIVAQGGSFLFPDPQGPNAAKDGAEWGQINARAALLTQSFRQYGQALGLGIGATDFSSPAGLQALGKFKAPRIAANLLPSAPSKSSLPDIKPWRKVELKHKLSAALLHVVDPDTIKKSKLRFADPAQSLNQLLPEIKKSGVDLILVTAQGKPEFGRGLAEKVAGLDIVVITGEIESLDQARLGQSPVLRNNTWVLQPGDQAQTISHLRLDLPQTVIAASQKDSKTDHIPPASQWALQSGQSQKKSQIERLETRIAQFEKDPEADPAFMKRLRDELAELKNDTPAGPSDQVRVTIEQVKVSCHGPEDPSTKKALQNYDRLVATQNKEKFANVHAPKPKPGERGYVGMKTCSACHAGAKAFWDQTVHQRAYETLEKANKQYDLSCVGCHVTGFRKPGGSEVVQNEGLRDVQCEQCHGPGSAHVKKPMKSNISRGVPESTCLECHTPEHSDTFSYQPYLRDILGKGHGEQARQKLGDGPTAAQLRKAALEKAGGSCKKM